MQRVIKLLLYEHNMIHCWCFLCSIRRLGEDNCHSLLPPRTPNSVINELYNLIGSAHW